MMLRNRITTVLILIVLLTTSLTLPAAAEIPALQKTIEDPATGLNLQPGFVAELIYKVDKNKYGSWISMAFDDQNRLVVSDQGGKGVFRLNLPEIGETFSEDRSPVHCSFWFLVSRPLA
jgi:hypothetical protein